MGVFNKAGVLGTVLTSALNLGCCAPQVLGPLTGVLAAGGLLDRVPVAWQLPLLYGSLALALVGFVLGLRRHRSPYPLLLFLAGSAALLYPFHEALDLSVLRVLIWLGLGVLLAAAVWDSWVAFRSRRCYFPSSRLEAP